MKNKQQPYSSLLDTIEQLNKTISELKSKVNTLRKMCHNMKEPAPMEIVGDEDSNSTKPEITHE